MTHGFVMCSCSHCDFRKGTGGDRGIRTLDTLLTYTPLAGERLRPLGHVSSPPAISVYACERTGFQVFTVGKVVG